VRNFGTTFGGKRPRVIEGKKKKTNRNRRLGGGETETKRRAHVWDDYMRLSHGAYMGRKSNVEYRATFTGGTQARKRPEGGSKGGKTFGGVSTLQKTKKNLGWWGFQRERPNRSLITLQEPNAVFQDPPSKQTLFQQSKEVSL